MPQILQNKEAIQSIIGTLLNQTSGIEPGSMNSSDKEGLARDLTFKRIASMLYKILEDRNSDQPLREKSLELLLQLGLILGNAEYMLAAA